MTCHSQHLCESLKMQNNKACYKRMRLEILAIAHKHLDPNSSCSMQVEAVQAVMDELAARWPDFFGEDEDGHNRALKRAMAYIRQQHSSARSRIRCSKVPKVKKPTNANVPVKKEALDPPSTESTQIPLVERMARNLEYYASQGSSPSTSTTLSTSSVPITSPPSGSSRKVRPFVELTTSKAGPSTIKNTTTETTRPLPTRVESLCFIEPSSSSPASPPQSCPFESTQQVAIYRAMPSMPDNMNVRSIHQFLQTCLPPMDHFLHRFINAGLRTEEGLLGVSRWTRELIESFVDQLPAHSDGSPVLLMEKMVLVHQFATYFL